jgi:hypothetical protein
MPQPPLKKARQQRLGAFFSRVDGKPLSEPTLFRLGCPYCDFQATSEISRSGLPGALRAHVQWRHPDDFFDASVRLHAAFSAASQSLFDYVAMDPIPEEEEEEKPAAEEVVAERAPPIDQDRQAAAPRLQEKAKRLRHSYSIKQKFKTLLALDKAEAVIKASLSADAAYFAVYLHEQIHRKTGIPVTTLRRWIDEKEAIRKVLLPLLLRPAPPPPALRCILKRSGKGRVVALAAVAPLSSLRRKLLWPNWFVSDVRSASSFQRHSC